MSKHKLVVLAVVAALGVGAALWSTQTRKPAQEAAAAQPLVPGLQAAINDVTALRIVTPGNTTVATIERGDAGWTLKEKGGYAVDTTRVRDFLVTLAQAKRLEAKTSNPELYGRLGLADVAQADATGTQVEIDGLAQPMRLIVGQNVQRGTGTFVRAAGEAQSWQVDANIAVEREAAKWLQPEIVDIAPSRIESVSIRPPEGAAIEIVKADGDGAADFVLRTLPKGREPESEFVADAAAGLLSGLRLDDVEPASAEPGEAKVTTSQFRLDDGTSLTLTSWKVGDKTLARLAATLDEAKAAAFVEQAQARAAKEAAASAAAATDAATTAVSGAVDAAKDDATAAATPDAAAPVATPAAAAPVDPAADREQRLAAIREGVNAMQARFANWTYTLPGYKASNLNKTLEDYLKPKA